MKEVRINSHWILFLMLGAWLSVIIFLFSISLELKADRSDNKNIIVQRENVQDVVVSFNTKDTTFYYKMELKK